MIRARSASVKPLQPPISERVRQQPRQRLEAPSTMQTFTQGVAIERGGPGGGADMAVTKDNLEDFFELRLKEAVYGAHKDELTALLAGFHELVPPAVASRGRASVLRSYFNLLSVEAIRICQGKRIHPSRDLEER